jgi:ribosome-binding factor A
MSVRSEKVASVIKRALVEDVSNLANEHSVGLATITSVKLTNDLHIAKVYISIYGGSVGPGEFLDVLEEKSRMLRAELGHKIRLRYTPELRFYLDDTLEQMEHIQELIKSVHKPESDTNESTHE